MINKKYSIFGLALGMAFTLVRCAHSFDVELLVPTDKSGSSREGSSREGYSRELLRLSNVSNSYDIFAAISARAQKVLPEADCSVSLRIGEQLVSLLHSDANSISQLRQPCVILGQGLNRRIREAIGRVCRADSGGKIEFIQPEAEKFLLSVLAERHGFAGVTMGEIETFSEQVKCSFSYLRLNEFGQVESVEDFFFIHLHEVNSVGIRFREYCNASQGYTLEHSCSLNQYWVSVQVEKPGSTVLEDRRVPLSGKQIKSPALQIAVTHLLGLGQDCSWKIWVGDTTYDLKDGPEPLVGLDGTRHALTVQDVMWPDFRIYVRMNKEQKTEKVEIPEPGNIIDARQQPATVPPTTFPPPQTFGPPPRDRAAE